MATRTKMTPFARFMLVLLFLVPAAYIVASYVNGEDPIANMKRMVGLEANDTPAADEQTYTPTGTSEVEQLRAENAQLRRQVQELEAQLRQLQGDDGTSSNRRSWGN